ncbi:MAG: transcriptional repressor [Candidatus Taylorbacteria bacterium]|nr:transcriptional repressor [Candidatus Taylorbacteria bacterium]
MVKFNNKYLRRELDGTGLQRLVNSRDDYWGECLRATKARIEILDLLKNSYEPLSAEEITKKLGSTHVATVYRILGILIRMNLVWKIYSRTRKRALFEIKPVFKW